VRNEQVEIHSDAADPLFILAPPCTFSWAVCAMLGQHPEMYALPELHLFTAETVRAWLELASGESFEMDHGLVRTVAELYFGGQTDRAASRARGWLRRRSHFTTGLMLEAIADRMKPLIPVEKSPSIVFSPEALQRALAMFPTARFLHLVSHPRLYGETVVQALRELARGQSLPPSHWLVELASYRPPDDEAPGDGRIIDPQNSWYAFNMAIVHFLSSVPDEQWKTIRGEDLFTDSSDSLRSVAAWLGIRTDSEAVEEMKHPERSPYACLGPSSAPFGSDIFLLNGPLTRPEWAEPRSLEGSLGWREDGEGFSPELKCLAQELGYK
jgi:sulfotransferase family protein